MAISLYDLSVPTFLQTIRAVGGFLDRAAVHCAETGSDPDDFVEARLFDDMAPFHFQIEAAWHHAMWGLEAARTGVFDPPALVGPVASADLRTLFGHAETALAALKPACRFDRMKEISRQAAKRTGPSPGARLRSPRPGVAVRLRSGLARLNRASAIPIWARPAKETRQ